MRVAATCLLALLLYPAYAQEQSNAFDYVDIKKGGLGEFVDGQLRSISGGVEIALRSSDETSKPMLLRSTEVVFLWGESKTTPAGIQLTDGVSVDGPQGLISSNRADLDLTANTLTFSGNVRGSSESIASFNAERIVYDTATGDATMTSLTAQGIKLSGDGSENGFSSMNVDRAGSVIFRAGQVQSMQGGVTISLQSSGQGKGLVLHAGEANFTWSGDGGQPTAIALRGNVRVDGPQGTINANRGDFNLAKNELIFSGNVQGGLPQIDRFDADTLKYAMDGGETLMTNVRATGLDLQSDAEGSAEQSKGYSSMDIEQAPEVSLAGQKLNWMRGGVKLVLHSSNKEEKPMTIEANEMSFHYESDEASRPQRILLDGGVRMQSTVRNVSSNTASLDFATNVLSFSGDVAIDTPDVKDSTATEFSYNIATGQISSKGLKAKSIRVSSPETGTAE